MKKDTPNLILYMLLGAALIFSSMAVFNFIEPEGSNRAAVGTFVGVLLGIALGIIIDRSLQKR
ncbi:MAG TPA: hypothetical protein VEI97_07645 [bacterium]|nr:hypothetical protein [bacterium]